MKNLFFEVLQLQQYWSNINTPEMNRRGIIIRREIPIALKAIQSLITDSFKHPRIDLKIEGSDGVGQKTEIPWVRFASAAHSPNPREGWYCVYLFHAHGDGFYLAISHGSTRWENGEFKPRSTKELQGLVNWANTILQQDFSAEEEITTAISLGSKGRLGKAYEAGTVAAIWYPKNGTFSDEKMLRDIRLFSNLLGKLYNQEDLGRSVESVSIEANVIQELVEAQTTVKNRVKSGQGFGLTAAEKKSVEQHAMDLAESHLVSLGYTLEDVSKNHSYDFKATKDGTVKIVEVKGTTSGGSSIILTANEVLAHAAHHPNNILIIIHSIQLDRKSIPPKASGGTSVYIAPWEIRQEQLKALSYQYLMPDQE